MARFIRKGTVVEWLVLFVLCCLPLQPCFAQAEKPKSDQAQPQKLVVCVLDGLTGLPMWFEFPNIWIGSEHGVNPRLNIKGEARFDVREAEPRTLRFLPNWYADCRYKGDAMAGSGVSYSIDEILEHGIVAGNVCGWHHAKPKPGVIVLYVRHRTLMEMTAL